MQRQEKAKPAQFILLILLGGALACSEPTKEAPAPGPKPSADAKVNANSASVAVETAPTEIAAHMTQVSRVYKIPWPNDATPVKDFDGAVSTRIGTVAEITAFYREWMAGRGWTFETKYSTMDPSEGVSKSLGFTTSLVWCKRTSPITTVSIVVGSGDGTDRGKSAQIAIVKLPGEDGCP